MPHPPAGHGGDPQHLLGRRRALLDPGQQDVGQPERQRLAVQPGGQQLLGVERVALGAGDDVVDRRTRAARRSPRPGRGPARRPRRPAAARARAARRRAAAPARRAAGAADDGGAGRRRGRRRPRRPARRPAGPAGSAAGRGWTGRPSARPPARSAAAPADASSQISAGHRLEQLQPAVVDRLRGRPVRQRAAEVAPLGRRRHRREGAGRPASSAGQRRGWPRRPGASSGSAATGRSRSTKGR